MKAITLNNWLSIEDELKKIGLCCVLSALVALAYCLWKKETTVLTNVIRIHSSFAMMIPLTVRGKDKACQWDRFSLTLPISRKDVVTGQFRFFAGLTALNFTFCTFVFLMGTILSHVFSFEKPLGFSEFLLFLPMSLSLGMVGQCFMYLISLIGKDSTGEMMQLLGILVAIFPYLAPIAYFSTRIEDVQVVSYLASSVTVTLVVLLTGIAYVISVKLIEKKEF